KTRQARASFCHTKVTLILLRPYHVILTLALELECRRSVLLERVQSEFSRRNSDLHLVNPLRTSWRRDVIAPRGSPMRTLVHAAATPVLCWTFCARTILIRSISWATSSIFGRCVAEFTGRSSTTT